MDKLWLVLVVVVIAIVILIAGGYAANIVKLCKCDFQAPVKAEVIRAIGIVFPPVGVIAGYCTIKDGPVIEGETK